MGRVRSIVVAFVVLASIAGLTAQSETERDVTWNAFMAWFKAVPKPSNPLVAYAGKLKADGLAEADVKAQISRLIGLLGERSDWIEVYFDKVYGGPLTGNPAIDGPSQPSAWLVESTKGLTPGAALDAGMGRGRNAIYLARQGWAVTGFDISGAAVAATTADARKAGLRVAVKKASYDGFDFGANRWDLIVLAFAWAPVTDPAFVTKLRTSLRPGGRVVFENLVHDGRPGPNPTRSLKPNQTRECFAGFELASYEELEGLGDWGGPGSRLVRLVAVKR